MKLQVSFLFLTLFALNAIAGNEGGGGGAVVCRDAQRNIISAELLDLFEAPLVYNIPIPRSDIDMHEQIISTIKTTFFYKPFLAHILIELANEIEKKIRFLPTGIFLNKPRDIGENFPEVMQEGCELEGLGYYTRRGELLVTKPTYDKLSETDKAAFIIHEAIYYLYRDYKGWDFTLNPPQQRSLNSVIPREIIGMTFGHSEVFTITNLFSKYISDNDEIIEVPLVLPERFNSGGGIVVYAYQSRLDDERPNTLEVRCTSYSKNVHLATTKRDYLNNGAYQAELTEFDHVCHGLTVVMKYPKLIDKLVIKYNHKIIHSRMGWFTGENGKGLHFDLILKSDLLMEGN